jgi:hypothetical protein
MPAAKSAAPARSGVPQSEPDRGSTLPVLAATLLVGAAVTGATVTPAAAVPGAVGGTMAPPVATVTGGRVVAAAPSVVTGAPTVVGG